tara:strand:- start:119 stop:439 length:321 start_codon:yes stop_codon:yes gene_type:complete
MAFKLTNPPYEIDNTPIYSLTMEEGVLGKADRNGSILINKDITDPEQIKETIDHEKNHMLQMKRGDLDYDDNNVYWKGQTIKRKDIKEGSPALAWEKEANNNQYKK